jgi:uncharacterized membrane protein
MSSVTTPTPSAGPYAASYTPPARERAAPAPGRPRVASIDVVRGAVMVLMAIDHVRVYAGVPAGGPTPGVFFTRWVTHFCAPAFIFLAGTAAFLRGGARDGARDGAGGRGTLSRFLLTRGAWLVLLELTVLRLGWTFNADWAHFTFAGVIWAIGWCMILMAALVRLPVAAVGAFGVLVVALHNLVGGPLVGLASGGGEPGRLAQVLYTGGAFPLGPGGGGPQLVVLYSIVPWIGVMAAGYAFGAVMALPAERRGRLCRRLGAGLIGAFLVLRALDVYGDPRPWRAPPRPAVGRGAAQAARQGPGAAAAPAAGRAASNAGSNAAPTVAPNRTAPGPGARPAPRRMPPVLSFLATTKYPASLLFLLMTLGPTILCLGLLERPRAAAGAPPGGRVGRWLAVFGRVPFFYYALHIPLIHLVAVAISLVRTPADTGWLVANHPMLPPPVPPGYAWSLWLLYAVTAAVVVALYFPCRRFAALKARRRDAWLGYL